MPTDITEQIALQSSHSYNVRPGTPDFEGAVAAAIENAIRVLIETKYLYQKVSVDLNHAREITQPLLAKALLPGAGKTITAGELSTVGQRSDETLKTMAQEVDVRPWALQTRHTGDKPELSQFHRAASIGSPALGTETKDMPIYFYLPAVSITCGTCKRTTTFSGHASSSTFSIHSLYPLKGPSGTEQIFTPIFRCESCRKSIHTIALHRIGSRIHLCGCAPRREPLPSRQVPESLAPILSDAEQAVAEGDVFAGFYHLRTLAEHYMREQFCIPTTDQIRGEELIDKHYERFSNEMRAVLPSMTEAFSKLSENLHARKGSASDFKKLRDLVCDHIEMCAIMTRRSANDA